MLRSSSTLLFAPLFLHVTCASDHAHYLRDYPSKGEVLLSTWTSVKRASVPTHHGGVADGQQHLSVEASGTVDEAKDVVPNMKLDAGVGNDTQAATDASGKLVGKGLTWRTTQGVQVIAVSIILLVVLPLSGARSETLATALPVIGFMVCSSLMLIVNKMAVNAWPMPVTVLASQLLVCALGVRAAGALGLVQVEPLQMNKVINFGVTPLAFLATLVANIKVLELANVETFIMVRNATPLLTSIMDWAFLGRELPNRYSVLSLLMALAGAVGYMAADAEFKVVAYSWASAWLAIFLFDQIYIKHVISTVPMTPWTRVYYNNVLAGIPAVIAAVIVEGAGVGTFRTLLTAEKTFAASMLAVSCVMGAAMSYFAFRARDALSATAFTVVGNVCKVLSVLINVFVWEKHATQAGLAALFICMMGSALYRPAELREKSQRRDEGKV